MKIMEMLRGAFRRSPERRSQSQCPYDPEKCHHRYEHERRVREREEFERRVDNLRRETDLIKRGLQ